MDDMKMDDINAVDDLTLRESYDVKVELTQSNDQETGFEFRVTHPADLGAGERPIEVARGSGVTYRLVDWNKTGGPDLKIMLMDGGHLWLAELLSPVDGADMPEYSACLCEGVMGPYCIGEIVDISVLDWMYVDGAHRGQGVGRLAAMRLVEMLPHGSEGLLAFHVRVPSKDAVRSVEDAGDDPQWIESGEGVLEPNNRLADYFATDGGFERYADIMVSRRAAILRIICGD